MARVAVIIPVYNRGALVHRAIGSVLRQNFTDFELIAVDDGSTDDSREVIAAIADPRVRLVRQANAGANAARNRGIRESTAPIIAFLDSDDEYLPEKLDYVVGRFDREPDLGCLLDSYLLFNPAENGGHPQDRINPVIETSAEFLGVLFNSSDRNRRMRKSVSGISLRRAALDSAGMFDEELPRRQDLEFLARLARATRCAATDKQLWIKHETADAISERNELFIGSTLVILRRNPECLADRGMRVGVSREILRHFQQTRRAGGGWSEILRDMRSMTRELGLRQSLRLLAAYPKSLIFRSRAQAAR